MTKQFLYELLESSKNLGLVDIESFKEELEEIEMNLNPNKGMREYQKEALYNYFLYITNKKLQKKSENQILFHMATGSGKTYIMASVMLDLYKKGYRNFIFFVNANTIVDKTKFNFLDSRNQKYLFSEKINIDGEKVEIKEIESFSDSSDNCINIKFTTIQQLHIDLNKNKENSITYEDFKDRKIILIADEAHHMNTKTKDELSTKERKIESYWETTIDNILKSNKENFLIEFTATIDLKNKSVYKKYLDRIVYNYDLLKFRTDGYTKDFYNFQTNMDQYYRTLQALLLSQYRLKLFEDNDVICKPVVLLKSNSIDSCEEFQKKLTNWIKNILNDTDILKLRKNSNDEINKKMFDYYDKKKITASDLANEIKKEFSEEKIVTIHSESNNKEEIIKEVNNLDDKKNIYRIVITVDMLNEGWDVLNLFDIVRLYETRSVAAKGSSKSTIQEAQLIGRGVRYFPFKINEFDEQGKRKFDHDENNDLRICETLFFHSKQDSKYISELRKALKDTGFEPEDDPKEYEYKIKDTFKEKSLFKVGKIYVNSKIQKSFNKNEIMKKIYNEGTYENLIGDSKILSLYDSNEKDGSKNTTYNEKRIKIKDIRKGIVLKALREFPNLKFNKLSKIFKDLKNIEEFITSEEYIGKFEIYIKKANDDINNLDIYKALKDLFKKINLKLSTVKETYEGTDEFEPKEIKSVFKDLKKKKINPEKDSEGISQKEVENSEYRLDLSDCEWFVYNDNYGTTEEKKFVKFFEQNIHKLKEKNYKDIFLIRNEKAFKIYSFKNGEAFEPDYVLFLRKENEKNFEQQQIFIEPKGDHLLEKDGWKEKFLLEIKDKAKLTDYGENEDYKVIGLPFFNKNEEIEKFKEAFDDLFD